MATRAIYRVLSQLAVSVQVPDVHLAEGRAPPLGGDVAEERPRFTVFSGCKKPKDCFTATCYRGHWFWIDDRDAESKRVMAYLMVLAGPCGYRNKGTRPVLDHPGKLSGSSLASGCAILSAATVSRQA